MINLSFDDNDFKIAHPSEFFFSRTIMINFLPISARIQVVVSLSLCSAGPRLISIEHGNLKAREILSSLLGGIPLRIFTSFSLF